MNPPGFYPSRLSTPPITRTPTCSGSNYLSLPQRRGGKECLFQKDVRQGMKTVGSTGANRTVSPVILGIPSYAQARPVHYVISFDTLLALNLVKESWVLVGLVPGIYTSATSSKVDSYAINQTPSELKAVLLNKVVVGNGCKVKTDAPKFIALPKGYHSVRPWFLVLSYADLYLGSR